jgi:hypothetical protein
VRCSEASHVLLVTELYVGLRTDGIKCLAQYAFKRRFVN